MRIDSGGHSPIVVDDAGASVGKDEPSRHAETHRGHRGEVLLDGRAASGDAKVGAPDVRAEIQPVVDRRAVGGPRIVAAVPEQGSL